MFCMNCGAQIPDEAKYCLNCGTKLGVVESSPVIKSNNNHGLRMVPAKCTNCGGTLQVDSMAKVATCIYCNSNFVVEQAINNYNIQFSGNMTVGSAVINVNGVNIDNLLARALDFENNGQLDKAITYFNKVLDIDINNSSAKLGVQRATTLGQAYMSERSGNVEDALWFYSRVLGIDPNCRFAKIGRDRISKFLDEYVYIRKIIPCIITDNEMVEVRRKTITHVKPSAVLVYEISKMRLNESFVFRESTFSFNYCDGGKNSSHSFNVEGSSRLLYKFVENAQKGIFPKISEMPR